MSKRIRPYGRSQTMSDTALSPSASKNPWQWASLGTLGKQECLYYQVSSAPGEGETVPQMPLNGCGVPRLKSGERPSPCWLGHEEELVTQV